MSSLNLVRFAADSRSFAAGQPIFNEGQPGDVMFVVKEGEVDLVVHGKVVETVGPGGILGEMALIDGNPRSATAVAKTDCQLAPINEARLQFLVQQTPYFAIEVMRVLAKRLRHMDAEA
ncbi:MAG: cyclic nucleotide-binding domain-containing protein [Candidatus Binatia bacterium]